MSVKRYDEVDAPHERGCFVLHSDYAALEERHERMKKTLELLTLASRDASLYAALEAKYADLQRRFDEWVERVSDSELHRRWSSLSARYARVVAALKAWWDNEYCDSLGPHSEDTAQFLIAEGFLEKSPAPATGYRWAEGEK